MNRVIKKLKISIIATAILALLPLNACVKKNLNEIPTVNFSVDWASATRTTDAKQRVATIRLFPQFNYTGQPIVLTVNDKDTISAQVLPGPYKIHMYNTANNHIIESGDTFDNHMLEILSNETILQPISQLLSMPAGSSLSSVLINNSSGLPQNVRLTPSSLSKNMRIKLVTDKFPQISKIEAVLSGIASKVLLSTNALSEPKAISYPSSAWTSDNGKVFSSSGLEVLALYTDQAPVLIDFNIDVTEPDYTLTHQLNITDIVKALTGDEVEVQISMVYEPEIRITGITVTEWLDGELLEVEIS